MGIILTSTGLPLLTSAGLIASRAAAAAGGGGTVPLPEPKPEPGEITLQGPARSIAHRGVTFNFSSDVYWYESANGDPVLISHPDYLPSGTTITSISPASAVINGYRAHGAMRNPHPIASTNGAQGFDGMMGAVGGGAQSSELTPYSAALNVDPGANGPITINPGDRFAILKSVRGASVTSVQKVLIDRYVPLTIIDTLPPSAGIWFRPAVSLEDTRKAWLYRAEDMDLSVFRDLPAPSGALTASQSLAALQAAKMEHPPHWCNQHDPGQRFLLLGESSVPYARDYGRVRGRWACSLHIDPANQTEIDARAALAKIFAQWAIDIDGAHVEGITGAAGAGHWHGVIEFYFMGAFMFGNSANSRAAATAMLKRALAHGSNAFGQHDWIGGQDIGYPFPWWEATRSGSKRMVIETYQETERHVPEWRIQRTPDSGSNNLHTSYRDVQFTTLVYEMLSICLLRNGFGAGLTGDAVSRDGPDETTNRRAAALKYLDRLMTFAPWKFSASGHTADSIAMYEAWRDIVPSPCWTGRPDVPANPVDEPSGGARQIAPGTSTGQIAFRFDWLDYDTNPPILERQVQVSQDIYTPGTDVPAQFVDVTTINARNIVGTAGIGTLSGFRPGTVHLVRWRQRNAFGWSRWTAHWELADPSGSADAAYKAPRNRIATPGSSTTGQALSCVVAPAILHKPHEGSYTPLYEPVTDAIDVTVFYAGIGYWQGGTGALSVSAYQWQRSDNGSTGWTNIGIGQSYARKTSDSGKYIRCLVTVGGVQATSNVVSVPASDPDTASLINIQFNGRAPFDYPTFWANMQAGVKNSILHHYPTWQIEPDVTKGLVCFKKEGSYPGVDCEITPAAAPGTYNWAAEIGGCYFPVHSGDDTPDPTVIRIADGSSAARDEATAPANSLPGTLSVGGSFTIPVSGDRAIRLVLFTSMSQTGIGGAMGGPTISKLRIWQV